MTKKKDDGPWPEHPLFPAEDDEEPVRVEFIQVVRHDNGRPKIVPQAFRAAELQSLAQIHSMWGGGLYELIARRSSIHDPTQMGRLSGSRVRYEIPGTSRSLSESPDDVPTPTATPAIGIGTVPAAPADNSTMGMFMQMQMQMFQVSQENTRQQAEAQRRADERSRTDTQAMMQMMAQMQASSNQSMMGVVTALITRDSGGGAGGVDQIAKTAELFKSLGVLGTKGDDAGGESESIGSIISNVADIVSGAVELKGGMPGAPVPPGSAASALGMPPMPKKPEIG